MSKFLLNQLKRAQKTGTLKVVGRDIGPEIPQEIYNVHEIRMEGSDWWEVVELEVVDLSRNAIEIVGEEIEKLCELKILVLSHNEISALPQNLKTLTSVCPVALCPFTLRD
jgi:Leucine-rich repeat (LRR) protein